MNGLQFLGHTVFVVLNPGSLIGAFVYLCAFVLIAMFLSRDFRAAVHEAMARRGHKDSPTISFIQQFCSALVCG